MLTAAFVAEYKALRKLGWKPSAAAHAVSVHRKWAMFEGTTVVNSFSEPSAPLPVRLHIQPDSYCRAVDLLGDAYDPKCNPDIRPSKLKRQEEDEIRRMDNEGVWVVAGEFWNGTCWESADWCGGFVGNDWKDSGYDVYIMDATMSAAEKFWAERS